MLETMDVDEVVSLLSEGEWTHELDFALALGDQRPVLLLKKSLTEQGCFKGLKDAQDVAVDLIVEE